MPVSLDTTPTSAAATSPATSQQAVAATTPAPQPTEPLSTKVESSTASSTAAPPTPPAPDTDSAAKEADGPQVQGVAVPALGSGTTPYAPPTDADGANWSSEPAHSYPAVDIFVPGDGGCGGNVSAPVNGIIVEVRTVDSYDEGVDNPATRGGRSVAMVGDDGVRYYMSHFDEIGGDITPGTRVQIGQRLGSVGTTGRSGACHIHFGISPPCEGKEWSVRRGAINPIPYIDDWRAGGQRSPVEEVQAFVAANPNACAEAEADPNAAGS